MISNNKPKTDEKEIGIDMVIEKIEFSVKKDILKSVYESYFTVGRCDS